MKQVSHTPQSTGCIEDELKVIRWQSWCNEITGSCVGMATDVIKKLTWDTCINTIHCSSCRKHRTQQALHCRYSTGCEVGISYWNHYSTIITPLHCPLYPHTLNIHIIWETGVTTVVLIEKNSQLNHRHFITRQLYKWLCAYFSLLSCILTTFIKRISCIVYCQTRKTDWLLVITALSTDVKRRKFTYFGHVIRNNVNVLKRISQEGRHCLKAGDEEGFIILEQCIGKVADCHQVIDWLIEHGLTSAPTQYRLYGRRFLRVWWPNWPNQQCQSIKGGWLVIQTGLSLTRLTSPCYNNTTWMQILYKKII